MKKEKETPREGDEKQEERKEIEIEKEKEKRTLDREVNRERERERERERDSQKGTTLELYSQTTKEVVSLSIEHKRGNGRSVDGSNESGEQHPNHCQQRKTSQNKKKTK